MKRYWKNFRDEKIWIISYNMKRTGYEKYIVSILKIEAYYIRRIKLFIKINSKKVLTLQQATYIIDMVTR